MYLKVFLMLVGFLLICSGLLGIVTHACTRVYDSLRWKYCKNETTATIVAVEKMNSLKSKRLVEEWNTEKGFVPIDATLDRNYAYPYFLDHLEIRKYQVIFQWNVDDKVFRAHYPYMKTKKESEKAWKVNRKIELRYSDKKPWNYAIRDAGLWKSAIVYCIGDIGMMIGGMILIACVMI